MPRSSTAGGRLPPPNPRAVASPCPGTVVSWLPEGQGSGPPPGSSRCRTACTAPRGGRGSGGFLGLRVSHGAVIIGRGSDLDRGSRGFPGAPAPGRSQAPPERLQKGGCAHRIPSSGAGTLPGNCPSGEGGPQSRCRPPRCPGVSHNESRRKRNEDGREQRVCPLVRAGRRRRDPDGRRGLAAGCIPLQGTDTGMFHRAYYLSGAYGLWRPVLIVGLGAAGRAFSTTSW